MDNNVVIVDYLGLIVTRLALLKDKRVGNATNKTITLEFVAAVCRCQGDPVNTRPRFTRRDNFNPQNIQHIGHQEIHYSNTSSSSSEDEHLYTCVDSKTTKMPSTKVKINNVHVRMIIDTGASTNIIDEKYFCTHQQAQPYIVETNTYKTLCIWFQTTNSQ